MSTNYPIVFTFMFIILIPLIFAGSLVLRWIYLHGDFGEAVSYIWHRRWTVLIIAAGVVLLYVFADVLDIIYIKYLPPAVAAAACILLGRGAIPPLFTHTS